MEIIKHHLLNLNIWKLSKLSLSVDGNLVGKPYSPYFHKNSTEFAFISREYYNFFRNLNFHNEISNGISRESFVSDNALYIFDLSCDKSCDNLNYVNPTKSGTASLHFEFSAELPYPISAFVYMEHDSVIEIGKTRDVLTGF